MKFVLYLLFVVLFAVELSAIGQAENAVSFSDYPKLMFHSVMAVCAGLGQIVVLLMLIFSATKNQEIEF